jgi:hypothetical protein
MWGGIAIMAFEGNPYLVQFFCIWDFKSSLYSYSRPSLYTLEYGMEQSWLWGTEVNIEAQAS